MSDLFHSIARGQKGVVSQTYQTPQNAFHRIEQPGWSWQPLPFNNNDSGWNSSSDLPASQAFTGDTQSMTAFSSNQTAFNMNGLPMADVNNDTWEPMQQRIWSQSQALALHRPLLPREPSHLPGQQVHFRLLGSTPENPKRQRAKKRIMPKAPPPTPTNVKTPIGSSSKNMNIALAGKESNKTSNDTDAASEKKKTRRPRGFRAASRYPSVVLTY